jgi:hypothetical protein
MISQMEKKSPKSQTTIQCPQQYTESFILAMVVNIFASKHFANDIVRNKP